jgi:hypothetical protein
MRKSPKFSALDAASGTAALGMIKRLFRDLTALSGDISVRNLQTLDKRNQFSSMIHSHGTATWLLPRHIGNGQLLLNSKMLQVIALNKYK